MLRFTMGRVTWVLLAMSLLSAACGQGGFRYENIELLQTGSQTLFNQRTLATAVEHTCAIAGGQVYCWGARDSAGQNGTLDPHPRPFLLSALINLGGSGNWLEVSAGQAHGCAIDPDGALFCWGASFEMQLGGNAAPGEFARVDGEPWRRVAAGRLHSCAIKTDGSMHCWGYNATGQLANGDTENRATPTAVVGGRRWRDIAAGFAHTCGITLDGGLFCWGDSGAARLGVISPIANEPNAVAPGRTWLQVGVGREHTCAIDSDARLMCWGANDSAQVGQAAGEDVALPTAVDENLWRWVAAGSTHTCAVRDDATLWCWGLSGGALIFPPRQVEVRDAQWQEVACGMGYTCARSQVGVYCWGGNAFAQLGTDDFISRPAPELISFDG